MSRFGRGVNSGSATSLWLKRYPEPGAGRLACPGNALIWRMTGLTSAPSDAE